jgi:hypothetical protein
MCAETCADKGQPLGLLTSDGQFYLPVNNGMGAPGENGRLKPFAEQAVKVTGKIVERARRRRTRAPPSGERGTSPARKTRSHGWAATARPNSRTAPPHRRVPTRGPRLPRTSTAPSSFSLRHVGTPLAILRDHAVRREQYRC